MEGCQGWKPKNEPGSAKFKLEHTDAVGNSGSFLCSKLQDIPGVIDVTVDDGLNEALVYFEMDKISRESIRKEIELTGFKAK